MKKIKNNTSEKKSSNKVGLFKFALLAVIGIIMLLITPLIYEIVGNSVVPNCPAGMESSRCELSHGLQVGTSAAFASGIWVLVAIIILLRNIYAYIKANK